jgi:hypothetical protein
MSFDRLIQILKGDIPLWINIPPIIVFAALGLWLGVERHG